MAWNLYDFIDPRGQSVIADWLVTERITKRDIGQLNQKLDMLAINGPSLPPKLLAGPIGKTKHIYKLVIHGDLMLRPVSYTHLRAHETVLDLVCRLLLE